MAGTHTWIAPLPSLSKAEGAVAFRPEDSLLYACLASHHAFTNFQCT